MNFLYKINQPDIINDDTSVIFTLHGMGISYHKLSVILKPLKDKLIEIALQGNDTYQGAAAFYVPEDLNHYDGDLFLSICNAVFDNIMKLLKKYKLENRKIFLMGFSQGALISSVLAIKHPDIFSNVLFLNGKLIPSDNASKTDSKQNIFISQGLQDEYFSVEEGLNLKNYFESRGHEVSYNEYNTGHMINIKGFRDINAWLKSKL